MQPVYRIREELFSFVQIEDLSYGIVSLSFSFDPTQENRAIAHLVEHLLLRKMREKGKSCFFEAVTDSRQVSFRCKFLLPHLDEAIGSLREALSFDPGEEEIAREFRVIQQEKRLWPDTSCPCSDRLAERSKKFHSLYFQNKPNFEIRSPYAPSVLLPCLAGKRKAPPPPLKELPRSTSFSLSKETSLVVTPIEADHWIGIGIYIPLENLDPRILLGVDTLEYLVKRMGKKWIRGDDGEKLFCCAILAPSEWDLLLGLKNNPRVASNGKSLFDSRSTARSDAWGNLCRKIVPPKRKKGPSRNVLWVAGNFPVGVMEDWGKKWWRKWFPERANDFAPHSCEKKNPDDFAGPSGRLPSFQARYLMAGAPIPRSDFWTGVAWSVYLSHELYRQFVLTGESYDASAYCQLMEEIAVLGMWVQAGEEGTKERFDDFVKKIAQFSPTAEEFQALKQKSHLYYRINQEVSPASFTWRLQILGSHFQFSATEKEIDSFWREGEKRVLGMSFDEFMQKKTLFFQGLMPPG